MDLSWGYNIVLNIALYRYRSRVFILDKMDMQFLEHFTTRF